MTLAIMNITAVVSLRGLPSEAVYGLSSAFYYLFAAIVFLIPTAMVAAELAAMFSDKQGGVFRWVGEAFGAKTGFSMNAVSHDAHINQVGIGCHKWVYAGIFPVFIQNTSANIGSGFCIKSRFEPIFFIESGIMILSNDLQL